MLPLFILDWNIFICIHLQWRTHPLCNKMIRKMSSMPIQKFKLNKGNRNLKVENKLLKLAELQISWQIFRICKITVNNHWIIYVHIQSTRIVLVHLKCDFLMFTNCQYCESNITLLLIAPYRVIANLTSLNLPNFDKVSSSTNPHLLGFGIIFL